VDGRHGRHGRNGRYGNVTLNSF